MWNCFKLFSIKKSSILTIKYVFSFSWYLNCTSLVCKMYISIPTIFNFWAVLIFEVFYSGIFYMVIFQMFFFVCKLYKFALYITTYFGHGQCFIWEFLVLTFIDTARLNITSFRNFDLWIIYVRPLSKRSYFGHVRNFKQYLYWQVPTSSFS